MDALIRYAEQLGIQKACLGKPGTDFTLPNLATLVP